MCHAWVNTSPCGMPGTLGLCAMPGSVGLYVPCIGQHIWSLCGMHARVCRSLSAMPGSAGLCAMPRSMNISVMWAQYKLWEKGTWAHLDNTLTKWTVQKFCSMILVFTQWAKHRPVLRSPLKSNTNHLNMGWFMVTGSFKWKHEEHAWFHKKWSWKGCGLSSGWSFTKDSTLSYP